MVEERRAESQRRVTPDTEATPPVPAAPRVAAAAVGALRCPYCHGELAHDLLVARCEDCGTAHHASCFGERGSCSVHACRGRAAHVGTLKGRAVREAFGPCRACTSPIFLDERAALCKKCDAAHHPSCLETRGSCVRCGARDAALMAATEFARATAEVKRLHARSSMPAVATGVVLIAAAAIAFLWGAREICVLLLGCSVAEFVLAAFVYTRSAKVASLVSPGQPPSPGSSPGSPPR